MGNDWNKITTGSGDAGETAGAVGRHKKSSPTIRCLGLLEEAQINLGFCAWHTKVPSLSGAGAEAIEKVIRKILGAVSAWKGIETYTKKYPEAGITEEDVMDVEYWVAVMALVLKHNEVPMGWINHTKAIKENVLWIAKFDNSIRQAEQAFWDLLDNEEGMDDTTREHFSLEARYLNRMSKLTHESLAWQKESNKNRS